MLEMVNTTSATVTAKIPVGMLNLPFPEASVGNARVEFDFPDFDFSFAARLIDLTFRPDSRWATARVELDESVTMVWTLRGEPSARGTMRLQEASFDFEMVRGEPRAEFIADTARALLWLAGSLRLRIPGVSLDGQLHFERPPQAMRILRHRWSAYLLMVIESAFRCPLLVPEEVADQDWMDINFVHRALAERSFSWLFIQERLPLANEEQARQMLEQLEQGETPFPVRLLLENFDRQVAGRRLALGSAVIKLKQALLLNAEEIKQHLASGNSGAPQAFLRAMDGAATYEFAHAPRLPVLKWAPRITEFLELEDRLGHRLFQIGNDLAAGSLAGLTDEEIAAVTARCELGEEAFEFGGPEEEN